MCVIAKVNIFNRPRQAKKCLRAHDAQNVRIHIILQVCKVSSGPLLSINTFYSIQWFWQRTTEALIRLRFGAVWSRPSLSAHASKAHLFLRAANMSCVMQKSASAKAKMSLGLALAWWRFAILRKLVDNSPDKHDITKTCLYNNDPLKPHFYIVELGFTGVYIIFLISAQNRDCGYSLEPPRLKT